MGGGIAPYKYATDLYSRTTRGISEILTRAEIEKCNVSSKTFCKYNMINVLNDIIKLIFPKYF